MNKKAKCFLQKTEKDLPVACHIPPLDKAKKQGNSADGHL